MGLIDELKAKVSKVDESYDDIASDVRQAWRGGNGPNDMSYVREVYPDYVIVCTDQGDWKVPYTRDGEGAKFDTQAAAQVESTWVEVAKTVPIAKTDLERQRAYGWAYVMRKAEEQVVDHSGEFIDDPNVLEDAAALFNLHYREGDERHTDDVKAQLVENVVFTPDKYEAMGMARDAGPTGWWVGFEITDPEMWEQVKSGELSMLSIGGWADRELVDA